MQLDLIGAVVLTAISALVGGVYVYFLRWSVARRLAMAAVGIAWFALVAAFGATGAFDAVRGIGPAGVGLAVLIPFALLTFASTRAGTMREAVSALPVPVLIGLHATRVLGVFFLLLYAAGRLPAPDAPVAGWGDVLIGLTAIPLAYLVVVRAPAWRTIALLWNALGLLDLMVAIALGVASSPGLPIHLAASSVDSGVMTTLPWILIPCFNVPLLAHLHILLFQRLRSSREPAISPVSA
ncbi:hypothetical protein PQQ96_19415 [Paraburkholderia sediminicola]|uniref:hypothetical protein n=1 Tax=Paraburkholderia sediminicola TaxID=458836 RepID=UPI0038B94883